MAHGPSRLPVTPAGVTQDRDPTDTLNYASLLKVCGSATNAFINLADSSGLSSRRLLLVNADGGAKHVVAEVLINGRWIVVDPSFRTIPQRRQRPVAYTSRFGRQCRFFVRNAEHPQLRSELQLFRNIAPSFGTYSVPRVVCAASAGSLSAKLGGLPCTKPTRRTGIFSGRRYSVLALLFLFLVRISLRWYGESRLGIQTLRVHTQVIRAASALFSRAA